jgi:hypothetical protein
MTSDSLLLATWTHAGNLRLNDSQTGERMLLVNFEAWARFDPDQKLRLLRSVADMLVGHKAVAKDGLPQAHGSPGITTAIDPNGERAGKPDPS